MRQKIRLDAHSCVYPMPVSLIGAFVDEKPNYLAAAWFSRVNYKPALIGVALGKAHHTNRGILRQRAFSVNIPGRELAGKTDYCGLVSGKQEAKDAVFSYFRGELNVPLIEECPLSMECALVQTLELPVDTLFIGEVRGVYCEERFLTGAKPDIRKMQPFLLTMPDNAYWSIGERIGDAWSLGRGFKPSAGPSVT